MLSDRRQRVLSALIEEYVAHALPVGSRTIVEQYHLGVSSATVRNELSALEDAGYIKQPHTSAGRIPTDAGYREFVDSLLASDAVFDNDCSADALGDLRKSADALDELIEQTSIELTRLTDCLSIVMAPSAVSSHIRQISLISLSNRLALMVIVVEDGQVINHQMSFSEDVSPERLREVEQALCNVFVGHKLSEMQDEAALGWHVLINDPISRIVLESMASCLHDDRLNRTSRMGVSSLMRMPEFHDSSALLPIMEILEDDTVLFRIFDNTTHDDKGVIVRIGAENDTEQLSGVSVITGIYGRGDAQGVVAVIGPKRMDYSRVISAVHAAQNVLGDEI